MKIAILTFSKTMNYGANLQLFAIYSILSKNNHVEVINYNPLLEDFSFKSLLVRFVKTLIFNLLYKLKIKLNIKSFRNFVEFEKFREKIIYTKYYFKNDLYKLEKNFDLFVVGSDQVWNKDITGKNYKIFFLNFIKNKAKISFSASCGEINSFKKIFSEVKSELLKFSKISVREQDLHYFLDSNLSHNISFDLDPTFLLTQKEWNEVSLVSKIIVPTKFLLVYFLESNFDQIAFVNKLSDKLGIQVVNIGSQINFKNKININFGIGPSDFIYLINKATYIITNSYHGTVFSLIFKKKFISIVPKYRSSRIQSLYLDSKSINFISQNDLTNFNFEIVNSYFEYPSSLYLNISSRIENSFLFFKNLDLI